MRRAIKSMFPVASYFEGEPTPTPTPTPTPEPTPTPTATFVPITTQEQLNTLMAANRRTLQTKNEELVRELETKKNLATTTAEEKTELETRITNLQNEFQTDKQQSETKYKQLETKYTSDTKKLTEKGQVWEERYTSLLVDNELLNAATDSEFKAYNPKQIVGLIRNQARKVETTGPDGKPTGQFTVKVKWMAEQDGKQVELDLTPREVVKAMKETPQQYGNLFSSGATGGMGDFNINPSNGGGQTAKLGAEVSMEDYVKNRDATLASVTNTGR